MTEGVFERIVQHRCSHVEEGLHRRPVPAHLLLLVHAFGDDLVDRTLHERGRDRFAVPAPGGVMHQRSLVPLEVGQQLAGVVFQAPDACYANEFIPIKSSAAKAPDAPGNYAMRSRFPSPDRGCPASTCLLYTSDAADEEDSVDLG